jgi:hypothetical protein
MAMGQAGAPSGTTSTDSLGALWINCQMRAHGNCAAPGAGDRDPSRCDPADVRPADRDSRPELHRTAYPRSQTRIIDQKPPLYMGLQFVRRSCPQIAQTHYYDDWIELIYKKDEEERPAHQWTAGCTREGIAWITLRNPIGGLAPFRRATTRRMFLCPASVGYDPAWKGCGGRSHPASTRRR